MSTASIHSERARQRSCKELHPSVVAVADRKLPEGASARLDRFKQNIAGRSVVYLSTPITTGLAYLSGSEPDSKIDRTKTFEDNVRRARLIEAEIQGRYPDSYVINPTNTNVPTWEQEDYHRFWVEVLKLYVDVMVFADGWQYSNGCGVEYTVGACRRLKLLDRRWEDLSGHRAVELLSDAIARFEEVGLPTDVPRAALTMAREGTGHRES